MSEFALQTLEQAARVLRKVLEERDALRARLRLIEDLCQQDRDARSVLDEVKKIAEAPRPRKQLALCLRTSTSEPHKTP